MWLGGEDGSGTIPRGGDGAEKKTGSRDDLTLGIG